MSPEAVTREVTPLVGAKKARLLIALVALSLLASLLLLLRGPGEVGVSGPNADGYSRSALGHIGMLRWLRANDHTVVQLRTDRHLGECGLLVVAEPEEPTRTDELRIDRWYDTDAPLLLVLPKRTGIPAVDEPGWIDHADLEPLERPRQVLTGFRQFLGDGQAVLRTETTGRWTTPLRWPTPELVGPVQLLRRSDRLTPIVHCPEGVLFGSIDGHFVLADPDLLANHGLVRGRNAELLLQIVDECAQEGVIVVDETLHGHLFQPSFWQALGEFPLVLVLLHLLLMALLVVWMARGRFGPLLRDPPPIGAGKAFLIDNVVTMLPSRHLPVAADRWRRQQVARCAARLGASRSWNHEQNVGWLLSRLADSAHRAELEALLRTSTRELTPTRALEVSRRVRELTMEIVHAGN